MSEFELHEDAVAQTEEMLRVTGESVNREATAAADEIVGVQNAAWMGQAATTAANQQMGPFADAVAKLHNEINHMSEALGLGRVGVTDEDQAAGDAILAVNPDVGNFGRLAV